MENRIRKALDNQEFLLEYQPKSTSPAAAASASRR